MENVFGFKELGILAKKYGDEEPCSIKTSAIMILYIDDVLSSKKSFPPSGAGGRNW